MSKTVIDKIDLYVDEVEYPYDGRRKAHIQTNNERLIKKAMVDIEGKLLQVVEVYLVEDVDKHFVRKEDLKASIHGDQLLKELGLVSEEEHTLIMPIPPVETLIEKQKVNDAIDKIERDLKICKYLDDAQRVHLISLVRIRKGELRLE